MYGKFQGESRACIGLSSFQGILIPGEYVGASPAGKLRRSAVKAQTSPSG